MFDILSITTLESCLGRVSSQTIIHHTFFQEKTGAVFCSGVFDMLFSYSMLLTVPANCRYPAYIQFLNFNITVWSKFNLHSFPKIPVYLNLFIILVQ